MLRLPLMPVPHLTKPGAAALGKAGFHRQRNPLAVSHNFLNEGLIRLAYYAAGSNFFHACFGAVGIHQFLDGSRARTCGKSRCQRPLRRKVSRLAPKLARTFEAYLVLPGGGFHRPVTRRLVFLLSRAVVQPLAIALQVGRFPFDLFPHRAGHSLAQLLQFS